MPRPTSEEAKVPEADVITVDPCTIMASAWVVPPGPAPITWMYLPTSVAANDPDAEEMMADPADIAPSVRKIPSATAPNAVTPRLPGLITWRLWLTGVAA